MGRISWKVLWSDIKKARSAYIFLLPTLLGFLVFQARPLFEGIRLSFFEANLKSQTFIGLKNYADLMSEPLFWVELKNTLFFVAILVPLTTFLALGISLLLATLGSKLQTFFRAAFYIPVVSAGLVMSMVWLALFNPVYGLLNYFLSLLGFEPVLWLAMPGPAKVAICIVVVAWTIGIKIIIYLAALLGIPKTYYEAADLDGAGPLKKFYHITLPLLAPATAFVVVSGTIGLFQLWQVPYLLTGGGPAYTTTTFVLRIYQIGFTYFDFGVASTHAVVLLGLVLSIAIVQFRYLNKQLEY